MCTYEFTGVCVYSFIVIRLCWLHAILVDFASPILVGIARSLEVPTFGMPIRKRLLTHTHTHTRLL